MTTPMIPEIIVALFQNELVKMSEQIITIISTQYKLDPVKVKHLVACKLEAKLDIIPEDTENFKILKIKNRQLPPADSRCCARTYKDDVYDQCTLRAHHEYATKQLCKHHGKVLERSKCLRHGTISDAEPLRNPQKKHTKLY